MTNLEPFTVPGLRVQEELARTGLAIAYRARRNGSSFVVRVGAGPSAPRSETVRFRREAVALARSHEPSLPEVLEVRTGGSRPYLVSEDVEGEPLSVRLVHGPLPEHELLSVARAASAALAALHAGGLVHGNVTPRSLVRTREGYRLVGYGQGPDPRAEALYYFYAAPEQLGILRRPVDGRADLRALGAVLFECATGRVPVQADGPAQLVRRLSTAVIPDVRTLGARVGEPTAVLIARLLAHDPEDRPSSARAVRAAVDGRPPRWVEPRAALPFSGRPLADRRAELSRLHARWDEARTGRSGVVALHGPVGIGKTHLAVAFAQSLGHAAGVLFARCDPGDPRPFSGLRSALEDHLRALDRQEDHAGRRRLRRLATPRAPLLRDFTPALDALLEGVPARGVQDFTPAEPAEHLILDALAELFLGLAAPDRPVLLVVDGLEFADQATLRLVRRITAAMTEQPLMILCTARAEPGRPPDTRWSARSVEAIAVPPLAATYTLQLVEGLLGGRISGELADELVPRSGGNPLAAEGFVRALIDAGRIGFALGRWTADVTGFDWLPIPGGAQRVVTERLVQLSAEAREILAAAAVLGVRFDPVLVTRVAGCSPEAVSRAVSEGISAGVLSGGALGHAFLHVSIREALLEALDAPTRAFLHQRAAEALDAHPHRTADLYRLADHYARGVPGRTPHRLYETNLAAGRAALRGSAYAEARRFLQTAERAGREEDRRSPEVHVLLAEACIGTRELAEAAAELEHALALTSDPVHRAGLRGRLSRLAIARLDVVAAREEIERAFAELGRPAPSFRPPALAHAAADWGISVLYPRRAPRPLQERSRVLAQLHEQATLTAYFDARVLDMLTASLLGLGPARLAGASRELVDWRGSHAVVLGLFGLPRRADRYARRAVALAERLGDPATLAHARMYEGFWRIFHGLEHEAEVQVAHVLDEERPWVVVEDLANAAASVGWSLLVRGHVQAALQRVEATIAELEELGQGRTFYVSVLASIAMAAAAIGSRPSRVEENRRKAEEAARQAVDEGGSGDGRETPFGFVEAFHLGCLLLARVVEGDVGPELDALVERFGRLGVRGRFTPLHLQHFLLAEALARLLRVHQAAGRARKDRLAELGRSVRALHRAAYTPLMMGHVRYLQAAVAREEGRYRRALRLLERSETLARRSDAPWSRFEIARIRADVLSRMGRRTEALAEARVAHALAVVHDWPRYAQAVQAEFRLRETAPPGEIASPAAPTRQRRQLEAVLAITRAAASIPEPEQLARAAVSRIAEVMGAERAWLLTLDASGDCHPLAAVDNRGEPLDDADAWDRAVAHEVCSRGVSFLLPRRARKEEVRSLLAVPLLVAGRVTGALYLDSRIARGLFDADDQAVLESVAAHVAVSLESARALRVELDRQRLAVRADELARSNAELRDFAYVASHELQEPLRMIRGYADLLARRYAGRLDEDADTFLGFLSESGARLQGLVDGLLEYARVESRGGGFEPFDAARLVEEVLADLRPAIEAAGATVETGPLPVVVGDRDQLGRVFRHLVDNAVRYRRETPPQVRIGAERTDDAWIFSVEDRGLGVAAADRQRIFRLLERAWGPGEIPGAGVGLAVSRRIVERHGGRIWVEPAPEGGSVFRFSLPDRAFGPADRPV